LRGDFDFFFLRYFDRGRLYMKATKYVRDEFVLLEADLEASEALLVTQVCQVTGRLDWLFVFDRVEVVGKCGKLGLEVGVVMESVSVEMVL
jgi:hypothetical protein